jgi:hypothetical protein
MCYVGCSIIVHNCNARAKKTEREWPPYQDVRWRDQVVEEQEVRSSKRKRIEEPEVVPQPVLEQGLLPLAQPDILPHCN